MSAGWVGFFCGLWIGFTLGIFGLAIFVSGKTVERGE